MRLGNVGSTAACPGRGRRSKTCNRGTRQSVQGEGPRKENGDVAALKVRGLEWSGGYSVQKIRCGLGIAEEVGLQCEVQ
jgi:hypothetical protein